MTAMGKMLIFLVLILSLVWNGLTINAYVTRTNWRAEAKKYQDKALEAAEAANKQKILLEQERESLEDIKRALRAEIDRIYNLKAQLEDERTKLITSFNQEFSDEQKKAIDIGKLQANVQRLQSQVNDLDKALLAKEKDLDEALLERDKAKVAAQKSNLDAVAEKERAERLQVKLQETYDQLQDALQKLGGGGTRTVVAGPRPPQVPENLRGTVLAREVSGGDVLVTLSVGLDQGVQKGSELKVARLGANAKYLGTLIVLTAEPKQSVARFKLPAGVTRPTAADYPARGDEVTANK